MTDTKHNAFEAWLDEPHPADSQFTRRDYMPKNDGGFSAMVWQAATEQGKRQPLSDEQKRAMFKEASSNRHTEYESYLQGIEDCEATPQGKI